MYLEQRRKLQRPKPLTWISGDDFNSVNFRPYSSSSAGFIISAIKSFIFEMFPRRKPALGVRNPWFETYKKLFRKIQETSPAEFTELTNLATSIPHLCNSFGVLHELLSPAPWHPGTHTLGDTIAITQHLMPDPTVFQGIHSQPPLSAWERAALSMPLIENSSNWDSDTESDSSEDADHPEPTLSAKLRRSSKKHASFIGAKKTMPPPTPMVPRSTEDDFWNSMAPNLHPPPQLSALGRFRKSSMH
jgi:hypothetical protein